MNNFKSIACDVCSSISEFDLVTEKPLVCTSCDFSDPQAEIHHNFNTGTRAMYAILRCKRCNTLDISRTTLSVECIGCGKILKLGKPPINRLLEVIRPAVIVSSSLLIGGIGIYLTCLYGKHILPALAVGGVSLGMSLANVGINIAFACERRVPILN